MPIARVFVAMDGNDKPHGWVHASLAVGVVCPDVEVLNNFIYARELYHCLANEKKGEFLTVPKQADGDRRN